MDASSPWSSQGPERRCPASGTIARPTPEMIQADELPGGPPPETAMSPIVQQKDLDECMRALGRPLWDYEFRVLEEMMLKEHDINQRLKAQGKGHQMKSLDELVHIFIRRLQVAEAKKSVTVFMQSKGIGYR